MKFGFAFGGNVLPPVDFTHCEAQGQQYQSLRRRRRFVGGEVRLIFIGVRSVPLFRCRPRIPSFFLSEILSWI